MAKFAYIHSRPTMLDPNGGEPWVYGEVRKVTDLRQIQRLALHPDCFAQASESPPPPADAPPADAPPLENSPPPDETVALLETTQRPMEEQPIQPSAQEAPASTVETEQAPIEPEPEVDETELIGTLPPLENLSKSDLQRIARREFGQELDGTLKVSEMRSKLAALMNGSVRT
jgi:hypothetical protein